MVSRFSFPLLFLVVFAACDTAEPTFPTVVASPGTSVHETADGWRATSPDVGGLFVPSDGGVVDLRFEAPGLAPEGVLHAVAGPLGAVSARIEGGARRVSFSDAARGGLRIEGVREGQVVATTPAYGEGEEYPAGETEDEPTSVHYRRVCSYGECVHVIEYDYDRVAGGETTWTAPGGQPVNVDRVRLVATATGRTPDGVRVGGFRSLEVVE